MSTCIEPDEFEVGLGPAAVMHPDNAPMTAYTFDSDLIGSFDCCGIIDWDEECEGCEPVTDECVTSVSVSHDEVDALAFRDADGKCYRTYPLDVTVILREKNEESETVYVELLVVGPDGNQGIMRVPIESDASSGSQTVYAYKSGDWKVSWPVEPDWTPNSV